jgi:hypothetical protein
MTNDYGHYDGMAERNKAIKLIRAALRRRSGKAWSVRGGTGTACGHIYICAPPRRCIDGFYMTPEEAAELHELLGFGGVVRSTSGATCLGDYSEYIDRANGTYSATTTKENQSWASFCHD